MQMTFRWFGADDPIPLAAHPADPRRRRRRQRALRRPRRRRLADAIRSSSSPSAIDDAGLALAVVESIPVHEDIKLGRPIARPARRPLLREHPAHGRARHSGALLQLHADLRLDAHRPRDATARWLDRARVRSTPRCRASTCRAARAIFPAGPRPTMRPTLQALLAAYKDVNAERLWENLAYFLERVVPVADECRREAWRSTPTIRRGRSSACRGSSPSGPALERLASLVDSPANGVTFCTGSLGADPPTTCRRWCASSARRGRIHFMHCRNVKRDRRAKVSREPASDALRQRRHARRARALRDTGFTGPMRPDHGRMIWGETRPARLRAVRPRARRDVPAGAVGRARARRRERMIAANTKGVMTSVLMLGPMMVSASGCANAPPARSPPDPASAPAQRRPS